MGDGVRPHVHHHAARVTPGHSCRAFPYADNALRIDKNNMDILGITLRHRDESRAEKPGSRRQSRKRGSCCATSTGTPGDNYVAEETGSDELRVDVDGQQLALLLVPQRLGRRRLLLAILAALLLAVVLIVVVVVVVTQR